MRKYGQGMPNRLIAVVLPHDYQKAFYFIALHEGISDIMSNEGYGMLVMKMAQLEAGLLPATFRRGEIDGIITYGGPEFVENTLDRLQQETSYGQPPTVSLIISTIERCSAILVDRRPGTSAAINHLLDLGHRYFLYIQGQASLASPFIEDLAGYRQACEAQGYDPDEHIVTVPIGHELRELAFHAINHPYLGTVAGDTRFLRHPIIRILKKRPEITAILAPNDASAILIYHILQTAGYRVPEDISLIGFDDTDPLVLPKKRNILTTVRMPLKMIGRAAAKLLIARMTGQIEQDVTKILPTTLIVRETTAPAKQR
jgi:LacI family transcriptional regulator